jgi:hypothetical protein
VFECRRIRAVEADGVHDLVSRQPLFDGRRDELRWMLKVCVESHDRRTSGYVKASHQGVLVAKVPRQADSMNTTISTMRLYDTCPSLVTAAVIDENHLE